MTRNHEKLLIAALAGMIIAGAAIMAIQPAIASGLAPKGAIVLAGPSHEVLNLRLTGI